LFAQDIELFEQFNGQYDYTAIGNTLNSGENNILQFCNILDSSSAILNLEPSFNIIRAYLYWAGSGTGDNTVTLNTTEIVAEETYNVFSNNGVNQVPYFSCYADITSQIIAEGSTTYTLSDIMKILVYH